MAYIQGEGRSQGSLFPVVLDDLIPVDHICRVIDAFVARLALSELGFERAQAAATGRPGYETVVRLITATTTAKGLKVTCRLDHRKYPVGRKITDEEFARVNLKPEKFRGEWNYTIFPR
jgi:hypothetical protein